MFFTQEENIFTEVQARVLYMYYYSMDVCVLLVCRKLVKGGQCICSCVVFLGVDAGFLLGN